MRGWALALVRGHGGPVFLGLQMAFQASALAHAAPLSMSEVLDSVRARYPLVEAARQDFQAARGEVVSSRGAFDLQLKSRAVWDIESYYPSQTLDAVLEQPTPIWGLSFFGGYRYGRGSFPVYDGKLQTLNPGELRGGVVVPLLRDGPTDSRRVRIQRAEIGVSIAEAGLDQQFVESVRTARQRYWEWVAAGAKLKIAKKLLEIAETRDSQLSVQLKKGDASVFDRNDNLRGVLQRRSQLASAERQLQRAELELSLFVRDSKGQPVIVDRSRLPDGFPAVSTTDPSDEAAIQQKVELAVRQRPDLRRIQGQREQNDRELSLARNQFLPRLDFSLGVSRDLGNGSPSLSQTETEAAVMLEFPFPLRSARGRKDVAVATDLRLSAQQGLLADRIVTEIRDAESALRQSRERLQLANEELELALVLEKGERARFAHGDSNLIFVQLREQTTADAANRKVDADLDYQVAQAALDAAQGLPSLKNP